MSLPLQPHRKVLHHTPPAWVRNAAEKWHYIRLNPVRKGLVREPEEWRFVWMPESQPAQYSGALGITRPAIAVHPK
ncbi:MAG: hypothetical protein WC485_09235 [Opitutaceae bacterium]